MTDYQNKNKEWKNSDDIIKCLVNISRIRNIRFIKLFGGEPMLRYDLIKEIINRRSEYSPNDSMTKIAFTTNGYYSLNDEMVKLFKENNVILNISLDGPEEVNNASRISCDNKNVYRKVIENLEVLRAANCPFALISVLDERILEYNITIIELADYLSQYTNTYKIEPAYIIPENNNIVRNGYKMTNIERLLAYETEFINEVFDRIINLDVNKYIYENNFIRTLSNAICY